MHNYSNWLNEYEAEKLFEFLIRRKPTQEEINLWTFPNSRESFLNGVRLSKEYRYYLAHEFVTLFGSKLNSPKILFRHIPKSGGILFRQILEEASSIPALIISDKSQNFDAYHLGYEQIKYSNYPLITGHVPNHIIFDGYIELTLIREPRSRLLNLYRFVKALHAINQNATISTWYDDKNISTFNEFLKDSKMRKFFEKKFDFKKWIRRINKNTYFIWNDSEKEKMDLIGSIYNIGSRNLKELFRSQKEMVKNSIFDLGINIDSREVIDMKALNDVVKDEYIFIRELMRKSCLSYKTDAQLDEEFEKACDRYNLFAN